jgi:hypothetical protein
MPRNFTCELKLNLIQVHCMYKNNNETHQKLLKKRGMRKES